MAAHPNSVWYRRNSVVPHRRTKALLRLGSEASRRPESQRLPCSLGCCSSVEWGSRFIASDQHGSQCATRTYGGVSACSNKVRVKRDRAEAAIVLYIAKVLLSPEAIDIAKCAYQEAIREDFATREQ
jgi:hypothetical protein